MPDPSDRATYGEDEAAPTRRSRLGGIVAVLAMFGFGFGLWYVYDRGVGRGDPGPPPVVTADTAPVKKAPADPGGMVVPNQKAGILNQGGKPEPKIESLLPPPELPRAEPAPKPEEPATPPVQVAAPSTPVPPVAIPQTPAAPPPGMPAVSFPAANGPAGPAAETPKPEAPKPEAQPPAPAAPVALPAPPPDTKGQAQPAVAAAAPPVATPAPSAGGIRIQLASLPDAATADREWKRLQRANADLLGSLSSRVVPVQLEGKGTWYRLQAGPFADKAGAQQTCDALKQRKLGCFLAP